MPVGTKHCNEDLPVRAVTNPPWTEPQTGLHCAKRRSATQGHGPEQDPSEFPLKTPATTQKPFLKEKKKRHDPI